MKLVLAIVQDDDAIDLIEELTDKDYRVTKLATTGGFLKSGNTTLMIGVEEKEVKNLINVIEDVCKRRKENRDCIYRYSSRTERGTERSSHAAASSDDKV